MKKFARGMFLACVCAAVASQVGAQAQSSDALPFSRGFLVTGNFAVGGVDLLRAGGTGTINFSAAHRNLIPAGADVIGAYLFWETIEPEENPPFNAARFRGLPIPAAKASRVTALPGTGASCWGSSGGSNTSLTIYRADVLHLLPKQYDADERWTGKYLVNDADLTASNLALHTVELPQQGTGNRTTTSAGASLLVVYRHAAEPLRKIVLYDGVSPQAQGTTTTQTIRGFYESAPGSAKLTVVAGSGAGNSGDRLLFNGQVVATNPFPAPIDSGSDRGWAWPTFDVSHLMPGSDRADGYGETATAAIDHGSRNQNASPYECLTFAAIVFSTTVTDEDGDGLPDGIEDAPGGLKDPPTAAFPNGQPLPNLNAMGAGSDQRDLFVEINAMTAAPATTYGSVNAPYNSEVASVTDHDGHNHMPTPAVLKMVGDAYAAGGIRAHFDVGDLSQYRALGPEYACAAGDLACNADAYLVPSTFARGGELIEERACGAGGSGCQFADFPGTVGWPFGFQAYQSAPVDAAGGELRTLEEIRAAWSSGERRRRFDRVRQDYFHHALFAHARGKARSSAPCLDADGQPTGYDPLNPGICAVQRNPQFHVPSSVSGVGDLPGGRLLVTLGLWDNFVGTPFVQASTFLHELGHNLNLWHGGRPALFGNKATNTTTRVEPNCKPNYLSSMSYAFQVHGLFDNEGRPRIDYSGAVHQQLLERTSVSDQPLFPAPRYRAVWFAPAGSPLAAARGGSAATRFCNGARFDPTAPPAPMARIQALSTAEIIDWDGDPTTPQTSSQDVNFDGALTDSVDGYDDWSNIALTQIRGSRTARIFSSASGDLLDFGSGDLLDFGSGDLLDFGSGDLLDFGSGTHYVHFGSGDFITYASGDLLDFGSGDLLDFGSGVFMANGDLLDFGSGDLLDFGSGDLLDFGSGDLLDFGSGDLLDFGSGDLLDFGSGDLLDFGSGSGLQELDFDTARRIGKSPPYGLAACILGVNCADPQPQPFDPTYHRVHLQWSAPTFGTVSTYRVYRSRGTEPAVLVGTTPGTTRTFVDTEELPNGVAFTYAVQAQFDDQTLSALSDSVVVTAVNEPPVAVNDAYTTRQQTALQIAAPGLLANDTDVDSPATSRRVLTATSPANGTLTWNSNGSFTYTPNPGFAGTDTFTYVADNGLWRTTNVPLSGSSNVGTVTITVQRPR